MDFALIIWCFECDNILNVFHFEKSSTLPSLAIIIQEYMSQCVPPSLAHGNSKNETSQCIEFKRKPKKHIESIHRRLAIEDFIPWVAAYRQGGGLPRMLRLRVRFPLMLHWFILCTRGSGGTAHEGGGCDQSIGSTVSDAIIHSLLWSTATRSSPLGCFSNYCK